MQLSAARRCAGLLWLLGAAAPALHAQDRPASAAGIYSCVDERGRTITSDRPIPACTAKDQRVLNRDGSLKAIYPAILTVDERAAKEARERKAAEERAAQADAVRRDRNLLARYPDEEPHRKAREAALDTVRAAIRTSEQRLQALTAERKPLMAETEFYKGKPLPAKLRTQIDANDTLVAAQRELMLSQEAELERVNRFYDLELVRLKQLWAGAAPGSLGPLATSNGATPVGKSASNQKSSALN